MSTLTNGLVADGDIERVLINPHIQLDKLELGFEFGTWNYPEYLIFFNLFLKRKPKYKAGFNYVSELNKQRIIKGLTLIINRIKNEGLTEDIKEKYQQKLLDIITDYRVYINKKGKKELNGFSNYTKELYELGCNNPLMFNNIKWYEKLLKIFKCKRVAIIML